MDTLYNIFVSKPFKCRFNGTPYYPRLGWGCSSGDIWLRLNVHSKYDKLKILIVHDFTTDSDQIKLYCSTHEEFALLL